MQSFFEKMILCLIAEKVEFIVVGGICGVIHGAPIVTRDLDICYRRSPENIAKLAKALAPFGPRLRNFPPDLPFAFDERTIQLGSNFTLLLSNNEELDLLAEMSGIGGYDDVIATAKWFEIDGQKARLLSLENLIVTKEAAGRQKDLATLPVLRSTLELQKRQPPSELN